MSSSPNKLRSLGVTAIRTSFLGLLVGFFGTLLGMIRGFEQTVTAHEEAVNIEPGGDISLALQTTAIGLTIFLIGMSIGLSLVTISLLRSRQQSVPNTSPLNQ